MKKVFWNNPYQKTLITRVTSVEGNTVLFDATIAYSFAGGQESDRAYVNGIEVIASRREDSLIYYVLPEGHGLSVGDIVTMVIDWQRRYRLMRLHFAAELILEIVVQKYGFVKIGAHIAEHKARIDFVADKNISSLLPEIVTDFDAIVNKDASIYTGFTDEIAQRRFWEIDGFAQVSCGGTHVKSSGEAGRVRLKREHPGKSVERIEIRLVDSQD